jgi:hypothetical protein
MDHGCVDRSAAKLRFFAGERTREGRRAGRILFGAFPSGSRVGRCPAGAEAGRRPHGGREGKGTQRPGDARGVTVGATRAHAVHGALPSLKERAVAR